MAAAVDAQNLSQIVCILAPFFMAAAEATEATDSAKESEHILFFQSPRSAEEEPRGLC